MMIIYENMKCQCLMPLDALCFYSVCDVFVDFSLLDLVELQVSLFHYICLIV